MHCCVDLRVCRTHHSNVTRIVVCGGFGVVMQSGVRIAAAAVVCCVVVFANGVVVSVAAVAVVARAVVVVGASASVVRNGKRTRKRRLTK